MSRRLLPSPLTKALRQLTSLEHIFYHINKSKYMPVFSWADSVISSCSSLRHLTKKLYIHVYTSIRIDLCMYVSTYICYIWMHIDLDVCICVYLCIYVSVCIHLCVQQGRRFRACILSDLGTRHHLDAACNVSHLEMNDIPTKCKVVPPLSSNCFCFYFFINHLLLICGRRFWWWICVK